MTRRILGLALLSLMITACEEDQLEDQYSDSYRFFLYANINGLPLNWNAGDGGYAIKTNHFFEGNQMVVESFLSRDTNQPQNALMLRFRGSANPSMERPLNDFEAGAVALADASGMVRTPGVFDYLFQPDSTMGGPGFVWTYRGKQYYGDSLALAQIDSRATPAFSVELSNSSPNCVISLKHQIQVQGLCKAQLRILEASSSNLQAKVQASVGRINSLRWYVNDVAQQSSALRLNHNIISSNQPQRIKVEVQFESGCQETIEKTVIPGQTSCDLHLTYAKNPAQVVNPLNEETVEIIYYNDAGKRFSSLYAHNSGDFVIESSSPYNDMAEPDVNHRRLVFKGNALLLSADGSTVELNNIHGSFAVAVP